MLKPKKNKNEAQQSPGRSANNPQGITTGSNHIRRIAAIITLAAITPVLLAFGYLILAREPAVQESQLSRVAQSFADQQATNIDHLLSRMSARIKGAAQSPLALSAIASQSLDDIQLVEKAMLDYFPEVISLRIIPVGEMGTAGFDDGIQGLRNHIEVDMVRRTSEGEKTQPESYKFEGQWLTSITALVTHPRIDNRHAVIITTIDNKQLSEQLAAVNEGAGQFALEQMYKSSTGIEHADVIADSGSGDISDYRRNTYIPGTKWRISFTPSQSLLNELTIDQIPLYAALSLTVLAFIAAIVALVSLSSRLLEAELNRIIAAADRKSPLELRVPELLSIARQLRRATLRALRQSRAPQTKTVETAPASPVDSTSRAGQPLDLTNPLFQRKSMIDSDEEVLELDLAAEPDSPRVKAGRNGFPDHIFRAYDIRGNARSEFSDDMVDKIGRAIGSEAIGAGENTLLVGCDGRISSPRIKANLIRALMKSGCDVIDIGLVPTPILYFTTHTHECRSGIMVTGSHNPAEDNGFKIVFNQQPVDDNGIQRIRDRVVSGEFTSGSGHVVQKDMGELYLDEVVQDIAIAVPLKIVVDAGNGATGQFGPALFEELGCDVVAINCDVDGNFPAHSPDTSDAANLQELVQRTREEDADFGVAFDGDGDRLAVVSASGKIVAIDWLLMIFAQDVVSRNPGADVVFDVKCSRHLPRLISHLGGRPMLWKTGHAFMKQEMARTGALLGGEFSGHIFFGERWYAFDDGLYAAARLAEIISTSGETLDSMLESFPSTVATPDIRIRVPEERKFSLIDRISKSVDFSDAKVTTLDGIRVDFANGWGLIRASNTSAELTARFEADDEATLEAIKSEFREQIALVDPDLTLDF